MAVLPHVDLGHADIESKTSCLRLHLSSSATFAPSVEGDVDQLQKRLTACHISQDSSLGPWISRGSSLKLDIVLHLKDDLTSSDQYVLLESLSSQLQFAKIWQQLHYSPPSVQISSDETSRAHTIEVSLVHADKSVPRSRCRLHKLDLNVPFHDVRPPPGVDSATLETVKLEMSISGGCRRKRRRLQRHSTTELEDLVASKNVIADFTDSTAEQLLDIEDVGSFDPIPHAAVLAPPPDLDRSLEMDDEEDDTHDDDGMLLEPDDHAINTPSEPHQSTAFPLKRASSMSELELQELKVDKNDILNLVDVALRRAIASPPLRLTRGIFVRKNDTLCSLGSTAPALWSPGYLPTVASRAVFLPTISHAVASVYGSARSRARKRKATISKKWFANAGSQSEQGQVCQGEMSVPEDTLAVRLWQTVRRGVYSSTAARKLKPLRVKADHPVESHEPESELLDLDLGINESAMYNYIEADDSSQVEADAELDDDYHDDELLDCSCEDSAYESADEFDETILLRDPGERGILDFESSGTEHDVDHESILLRANDGRTRLDSQQEDLACPDWDSLSICDSLESMGLGEDECKDDDRLYGSKEWREVEEMLNI